MAEEVDEWNEQHEFGGGEQPGYAPGLQGIERTAPIRNSRAWRKLSGGAARAVGGTRSRKMRRLLEGRNERPLSTSQKPSIDGSFVRFSSAVFFRIGARWTSSPRTLSARPTRSL